VTSVRHYSHEQIEEEEEGSSLNDSVSKGPRAADTIAGLRRSRNAPRALAVECTRGRENKALARDYSLLVAWYWAVWGSTCVMCYGHSRGWCKPPWHC
jgi:hypothetical protein